MHRIQKDQGKALERISNDSDYPAKIKNLVEEIRHNKAKIKEFEDKQRRDEKTGIQ